MTAGSETTYAAQTKTTSAKLPTANTQAISAAGEGQSSALNGLLVNKATLATLLGCSVRKVDMLIEQRRIPVIRLGARCHRFDVADVLAALKG